MAIPSNPSIGQVYTNNVSNNNYIRVQSSHLLYKQALSVGTQYVINIPGFTP